MTLLAEPPQGGSLAAHPEVGGRGRADRLRIAISRDDSGLDPAHGDGGWTGPGYPGRLARPLWLRGALAAAYALASYLAVQAAARAVGAAGGLGEAPGVASLLLVIGGCAALGAGSFRVLQRRSDHPDPAFRLLALAVLFALVGSFAASPGWVTVAAALTVLASVGSFSAETVRSGPGRSPGPPQRAKGSVLG